MTTKLFADATMALEDRRGHPFHHFSAAINKFCRNSLASTAGCPAVLQGAYLHVHADGGRLAESTTSFLIYTADSSADNKFGLAFYFREDKILHSQTIARG
jgi:hypothetical protein